MTTNDPFFKDPNYIDADAVEQMFLKLDYKLDRIIKMLGSTGEKKAIAEIPSEVKDKMKTVLEKYSNLLSSWEQELFKDLSQYPKWSEKQKSIYDKIIKELPERKQQMDKIEDVL